MAARTHTPTHLQHLRIHPCTHAWAVTRGPGSHPLGTGYRSDLSFLIDIANSARRIAFAQLAATSIHSTAIDAPRAVDEKDDRDHERPQETDPPIPEDSLSHINIPLRNYFRSGDF